MLQISVDFTLIFRVSLAFLWGGGWAAFIQFNRYGKFLARERTWITVVVGIGIDLIIAFPWAGSHSDWYTVAGVIAASAVGIIIRSLHNEQKQAELNTRSYKLVWGLEDAITLNGKISEALIKLLDAGSLGEESVKAVSRILATTHKLSNILRAARRGDYSQRNSQ